MNKLKLDIGCGTRKTQGFTGVDKFPLPGVEVVRDLEKARLPFPTNSASKVVAFHVLEHIRNYLPLMEELWRVMEPDARLHVKVPNYKHENAYTDPTHVRVFTPKSCDFFDRSRILFKDSGWFMTHARFNIIEVKETESELSFYLQAKKNRILLVAPPASIHTIRLYETLRDYGHVVDVAARRLKGIATVALGGAADKEESIFQMPNVLRHVLDGNKYDVVHAHFATRYGHVLSAVPDGTRKILTVWGEDVQDEAANSTVLKERLIAGINFADFIISESLHVKKILIEQYGVPANKIGVIPFGCRSMFKQDELSEELFAKFGLTLGIPVLTSARVCRPQNNVDAIVEAFMSSDIKAQLLILTGNLSDKDYVNMLKEKSANDGRIVFAGTLNEYELSAVYNLSEAILSIPHIDSLSVTILEALACGTPIICSDILVNHERITDGKNGLFVNPDSREQLIDAMNSFATGKRKPEMSLFAKESVLSDSWEETAKTQMKAYDMPAPNKYNSAPHLEEVF